MQVERGVEGQEVSLCGRIVAEKKSEREFAGLSWSRILSKLVLS